MCPCQTPLVLTLQSKMVVNSYKKYMNDMDIYFTTDLCDDAEVRMSENKFHYASTIRAKEKRGG